MAKRIVQSVAEPFYVLGHRVTIGASVGGAVAPLDGRSAEALLKAADAACYRCKRDGRGTFGFFAHSMDDSAGDRRRLELWLRTALTKSQLSLHYQPIYCVETGRIVALTRRCYAGGIPSAARSRRRSSSRSPRRAASSFPSASGCCAAHASTQRNGRKMSG